MININKSDFGFKPDANNNQILFGMKALLNVNDDLVDKIIDGRPYYNIKDFYYRIKPTKQAMVSLIKGGAFDDMMDRKKAMAWYIWETCDKKERLTLQNFSTLIKRNMVPLDTEERQNAFKVYEFNRYLKTICGKASETNYRLDMRAIDFLYKIECESLIQEDKTINIKVWDKVYQSYMDVFRDWLRENGPQILQNLNATIFKEDWDKYAESGNLSAWEMEVLCFYHHEHELAHINTSKYGLSNFNELPNDPVVDKVIYKNGKPINLFKLYHICGTCIAKNKTKGIVTILTTTGVVSVKFRKEYFALFDKRISEMGEDGKKHVVETSWFDRGNMIMVQGIRSGDDFLTKKYTNSGGHQLYKIIEIKSNGDLILQTTRHKGDSEE